MIAITDKGKRMVIRPGGATTGHRFKSVTLTAEDVVGPLDRMLVWLACSIVPRFQYKHDIINKDNYMNDEQELEKELHEKGLTAPRITPELLDAAIVSEEYNLFDGSQLTVCVLTLKNGFTVTGESACVSPENFDEEVGRDIARKNARDKLWPLLGFALAEQLSDNKTVVL